MSAERLQKLLARAGVASRRKAEELILEGRVTVDGRTATLGEKADLETESVKVDGKRIRLPERQRYLLLNKPKGVLTTVSDDKGRPTVLDLVPQGLRTGLFPVGRLDFHTEGLLLLTTDGDFALKITHPRYGCRKLYEVKVKGVPSALEVERLRRGMVIDGRRTQPAEVEPLRRTARGEDEGNSWFEVQLGEGRSRQIREMFFRIGHPVQKLRRVAIGPLRDTALPTGAIRALELEEVEALRASGSAVTAPPAKPAGGLRGARTAPSARPPRARAERPGAAPARTGRPKSRVVSAGPTRKPTTAAPVGPPRGRRAAASRGDRAEAPERRAPSKTQGARPSRPAGERPIRRRTEDRPARGDRPSRPGGPSRPGRAGRPEGPRKSAPRPRSEAPWRRPERPATPDRGRPGRPRREGGATVGARSAGSRSASRPRPAGGGRRPGGGTPRGGRPPRPRSGR